MSNTLLVVGASGVVGEAAVAHFAALDNWDVVALSRRRPSLANLDFRHIPLDLTDANACRQAAPTLRSVTHVVYAAVAEKPGLVSGWHDEAQMQLNLTMLQHVLDVVLESAPDFRHITLLQGAKAYGAHAGHFPKIPSRESCARDNHANFYWLQEDYIREAASRHGFSWTIFRPQVVIGAATGVAMNPLLPVAAYAAIRREEGLPFSYPGGEIQLGELVDSALLSRAFAWAATADAARNEIFNITNGDVFVWQDAWDDIGAALGVASGPAEPMKISEYLLQRAAVWEQIVARNQLVHTTLAVFLGESHHYADILLRAGATLISRPTLLSTIKLRQCGFTECIDSLDSIRYWIRELQARNQIPVY